LRCEPGPERCPECAGVVLSALNLRCDSVALSHHSRLERPIRRNDLLELKVVGVSGCTKRQPQGHSLDSVGCGFGSLLQRQSQRPRISVFHSGSKQAASRPQRRRRQQQLLLRQRPQRQRRRQFASAAAAFRRPAVCFGGSGSSQQLRCLQRRRLLPRQPAALLPPAAAALLSGRPRHSQLQQTFRWSTASGAVIAPEFLCSVVSSLRPRPRQKLCYGYAQAGDKCDRWIRALRMGYLQICCSANFWGTDMRAI